MEKIKAWSEHIILHFWHCCSICKPTETTTDEQALQKMKVNNIISHYFLISPTALSGKQTN